MPEPTPATPAAPAARGPVARSPITPAAPVTTVAGWEVSARQSSAALLLTDLTPLSKVQVRAAPGGPMSRALDLPPGRAARGTTLDRALTNGASPAGTNALVAHSGPGEWLVLSPPGTAADMTARLERVAAATRADGTAGASTLELVTVTDLTHGRALLRVTGEQAPALFARLCTINFNDTVTPNGAAFRTEVAHLATEVIRDDLPTGRRSYLLHCERSSGQYLFDVLLDAGADLGVDVGGFTIPGI